MEKTIAYSGGKFNLRASAAVMIIYKEQFGVEYTEDFSAAIMAPAEAVKVGYRLLWAMAKCADDTIPDPDIFIDGLGEDFDLLGAVDSAAELMRKSLGEFATEESGTEGEVSEPNNELSERLVASALRCGFSVSDLNRISVGFLLRCISANLVGRQQGGDNIKIADENDIAHFLDFFGG
ncbi:MAG: hypothetical protein KIG33_05745 [Oscillospiraceae bacterium]|nr:hypothetical protein [Oscillospiraceae bacterium]